MAFDLARDVSLRFPADLESMIREKIGLDLSSGGHLLVKSSAEGQSERGLFHLAPASRFASPDHLLRRVRRDRIGRESTLTCIRAGSGGRTYQIEVGHLPARFMMHFHARGATGGLDRSEYPGKSPAQALEAEEYFRSNVGAEEAYFAFLGDQGAEVRGRWSSLQTTQPGLSQFIQAIQELTDLTDATFRLPQGAIPSAEVAQVHEVLELLKGGIRPIDQVEFSAKFNPPEYEKVIRTAAANDMTLSNVTIGGPSSVEILNTVVQLPPNEVFFVVAQVSKSDAPGFLVFSGVAPDTYQRLSHENSGSTTSGTLTLDAESRQETNAPEPPPTSPADGDDDD